MSSEPKPKKVRNIATKLQSCIEICASSLDQVFKTTNWDDATAAWDVVLILLAAECKVEKVIFLSSVHLIKPNAGLYEQQQIDDVIRNGPEKLKGVKTFQYLCVAQKHWVVRPITLENHTVALHSTPLGAGFGPEAVHYVEFDPALDYKFPHIKKKPATWLVDESEGMPPHPDPARFPNVTYIGKKEEGWKILDREHSHLVLNKCTGDIELLVLHNATNLSPTGKALLERLQQINNEHALERRNLHPSHHGKIYAFGISAGARHKHSPDTIELGHTKFHNRYTKSELRKSDGELLGAAAVTWALLAANLPIEITNELACGITSLGIPAFFSPTIDGSDKGYSFEFNGKVYNFPAVERPPPEVYYASVISIPGHRLPFSPIPPVYLHSFLTNLGAPVFRNPLSTPRWSPPPPFNLLPMPP
ncbi:uncharacterized protein EI90DRAFT_3130983 [Cantharellus anzutake]|uniref:uncharacterized protein n=1 Tax=Cantharellus anzutake TaxID=1750568 RepID=UPI001905328B|nr:uncharacterized protein EI90DRAFT_3130983 [Cantharellus anzutake]KAF8322405.1 hypothetical protein EI90DRAFT_3130983 [Cantharellus anzutake]